MKSKTKIAIYAGFGGSDSGAVANGYKGKDLNLEVANNVAAILRGAGHDVLQNRTTDINRNITEDANKANSWGADYVIEFHFNAGGGHGTETFCSIVGGESRELAERINNRIAKLGFRNRGVKTKLGDDGRDYFGIIRQTKAPACLVEVCFIDSISDMNLYKSIPNFSDHVADEIHKYVTKG
jgi:N-acetylmuramoyl-L-alanine amidase